MSEQNFDIADVGIIVVDHGSRRDESNKLLLEVVAMFREQSGYGIVEPAHMELAEPTVKTAFDRCVQQGAKLIVVHPYFLAPGRHWKNDIPALAAQAARIHPSVKFLVTAPLGLHPLMAKIMQQRIEDCLNHSLQDGAPCEMCGESEGCSILPSSEDSESHE